MLGQNQNSHDRRRWEMGLLVVNSNRVESISLPWQGFDGATVHSGSTALAVARRHVGA